MTFAELGTALNNITVGTGASAHKLKFAHYAWASAPSGDYGVYGQGGTDQFQANNRFGEVAGTGWVDWYTLTDDETAKNAIESCFKTLQDTNTFAWYLNTIQYEYKTNFLHYEWIVELG